MGDFTGSKRFTSIMHSGVISDSYNTSKLIIIRAFEKMCVAMLRIDFICHSGALPILSKGSNILVHIVVVREKPPHKMRRTILSI